MTTEIIDAIRAAHRERCFAMEQRKRTDLALGSFLRLMLGWSKVKPEAERKRIALTAARLIKNPAGEWAQVIAASNHARKPFEAIERQKLKAISALAKQLPVWSAFCEPIRGFGAASLAVIVAEAGDLDGYATHSKLWKRMGVAVLDGVRQGNPGKSAGAEDWIAHGYNRQRRSRLWSIGDTLIKGNRDGVYRAVYLARKKFELERAPDMRPIHAHRRAQRYMEKRLLRDLWRAWRRPKLCMAERPKNAMAAASPSSLPPTAQRADAECDREHQHARDRTEHDPIAAKQPKTRTDGGEDPGELHRRSGVVLGPARPCHRRAPRNGATHA